MTSKFHACKAGQSWGIENGMQGERGDPEQWHMQPQWSISHTYGKPTIHYKVISFQKE